MNEKLYQEDFERKESDMMNIVESEVIGDYLVLCRNILKQIDLNQSNPMKYKIPKTKNLEKMISILDQLSEKDTNQPVFEKAIYFNSKDKPYV